jgi:hypothetical protein
LIRLWWFGFFRLLWLEKSLAMTVRVGLRLGQAFAVSKAWLSESEIIITKELQMIIIQLPLDGMSLRGTKQSNPHQRDCFGLKKASQ